MVRGKSLIFSLRWLSSLVVFLLLATPQPVISSPVNDGVVATRKLSVRKFSSSGSQTQSELHLVIKLSDRRVYVYRQQQLLTSYPIAVGREGWETPTGQYQVIQKIQEPAWQHPFTGEIVPPGPENPLGMRWIGFWTDGTNYIGFHGTPNEDTVGQAASHGCIRMLNQDVQLLFDKVTIGTPVIVQP
ncbi:L,D-transpeptidase [Limnoraphis robusta]|uniref:L,D-transpeptidase n=1 Tax=Limnoraphis robusta CCNP1315 TaxID=3110306 RepID=A0ABU5TW89_9CYAN|nr:L,D-transpeptidase [Limnoraphis robusta]MEA5519161.1 L,D-transpeptidase [Limnoraphis robusta CCNP1315]MEA5546999.1 L,D-transpeptidase [Limnoraphis robusta CCNP1324]